MAKRKGKKPRKANIVVCQWFDDRTYLIQEKKNQPPFYITSVTTKLNASPKPWLGLRRGELGNREFDMRMREAQERGSIVHFACAIVAQGGAAVYAPPAHKRQPLNDKEIKQARRRFKGSIVELPSQDQAVMVGRFVKLLKILKPRIVSIEEAVYSRKIDAAGTVDYAVYLKAGTYKISGKTDLEIEVPGIYIIDLKTGQRSDDHKKQVATYAKIYDEMHGEPVRGALIVYLDAEIKTGLEGVKVEPVVGAAVNFHFQKYQNVARVWDDANPNFSPTIFDFPAVIAMAPERKKVKK